MLHYFMLLYDYVILYVFIETLELYGISLVLTLYYSVFSSNFLVMHDEIMNLSSYKIFFLDDFVRSACIYAGYVGIYVKFIELVLDYTGWNDEIYFRIKPYSMNDL